MADRPIKYGAKAVGYEKGGGKNGNPAFTVSTFSRALLQAIQLVRFSDPVMSKTKLQPMIAASSGVKMAKPSLSLQQTTPKKKQRKPPKPKLKVVSCISPYLQKDILEQIDIIGNFAKEGKSLALSSTTNSTTAATEYIAPAARTLSNRHNLNETGTHAPGTLIKKVRTLSRIIRTLFM